MPLAVARDLPSGMNLAQRLRRLDEWVAEGRNGRWFLGAMTVVFLAMLILAAATHNLTEVGVRLLVPALIAVGVGLFMRRPRRR